MKPGIKLTSRLMTCFGIDDRLKANFTWVLSGNLLYSACQWGIVLALAKLGSPKQVGEYALGLAISAPIVFFANLQLRALLASDVKDQFTFSEYFTFRLVTLTAGLFVIAGVVAFTQADWHRGAIIILVGLAQILEFVSDAYYGLMQRYDRMDRLSTSLMIKGPLALAALAVAMYVTRSVVWAIIGLALGRFIVLLSWDSRLGFTRDAGEPQVRVALQWNSGSMIRLLRIALPLGVISMLVSLNSSMPRYFVEAHCGSSELGIFSAIASLISAGNLVVSAFGQSIFLPVAKACAAFDRSKFRGFVLQTAALGGVVGGGAVLAAAFFGREILTHVFRPEYGDHADIFVRLMIAGTVAFIASGVGYVMTAARSLKPQVPLLVATVLAGTAASALWIPTRGLQGAADAFLVASFVQLVGSGLVLVRIDRQLQTASMPSVALQGAESRSVEA